ncbi:ABC transporter permease [Colwellia sp. 12G3]|uniref:ABC transporter permease n=1 Tax=Colwellia sp. 12G3 TaxID=2058299 RepID=UPI000C31F37B|nr:ABC transporter permease [Colwellia sp. 12G3]PKI17284.1 ABC transporter permease [Colwellia sp. 12G3]
MNVSIMKASVKKELWEFSGMLTWVPVALAGIFIVIPLLIMLLNGVDMNAILEGFKHLSEAQYGDEVEKVFFVSTIALFVPFVLVGFIVQLYYFITCLYDERRDQSVMFWRSLPVSDTMTIASKALTGAIVIPAIFYSAATVLFFIGLVLAFVVCAILSLGFDISLWALWSSTNIVSVLASIWLTLLPTAVWLLPLYAWLMLMSIYAKKAPFLWAVLPIVVLLIIEGIVVHYLHLSQPFFGHFIADYFSIVPENSTSFDIGDENASIFSPVLAVLAKIDYRTVIVSAALLFATYWFRVNKQES